jgi:hypothetical protein
VGDAVLRSVATRLRSTTSPHLRTIILAPSAPSAGSSCSLSLETPLQLTQCGIDTFSLGYGTPADCAAVALDPGVGLLTLLGLHPVLALVGPGSRPGLSGKEG